MRRSLRFSTKNLIWLLIINIALFQNVLLSVSSLFRYYDELVTLFLAIYLIVNFKHIKREHARIIVLYVCIVAIGLMGNATSRISRSTYGIILDIVYFGKLYISFVGASLFFSQNGGIRKLSRILSVEIHCFVVVGVILALISQFVNIGMTHGYRYGFKAFQYVYSSPGMLSQYCIIFLLILTIDLENKGNHLLKYLHVLLLFGLWLSTGRTRGIAVMFIWFFLIIISRKRGLNDRTVDSTRKRIRNFLKPRYIISALIAILIIGWDQIQYYLGSESTTARSLLIRGGFAIMRDYFPFGSGFATFGTEMAASDYSPLYYQYGLNRHWALGEGGGELTDCFWPAVGAEFGVVGLLLVVVLVFMFSKQLIVASKNSKYSLISCLTYVAYMLISSTATSVYTAYTTTLFIVIIVGLIQDKKNYQEV